MIQSACWLQHRLLPTTQSVSPRSPAQGHLPIGPQVCLAPKPTQTDGHLASSGGPSASEQPWCLEAFPHSLPIGCMLSELGPSVATYALLGLGTWGGETARPAPCWHQTLHRYPFSLTKAIRCRNTAACSSHSANFSG